MNEPGTTSGSRSGDGVLLSPGGCQRGFPSGPFVSTGRFHGEQAVRKVEKGGGGEDASVSERVWAWLDQVCMPCSKPPSCCSSCCRLLRITNDDGCMMFPRAVLF